MLRNVAMMTSGLAVGLFAWSASAQPTAEEATGGASVSTTTSPSGTVTTTATAVEKAEDTTLDHDRVVGRFGVTYFNIANLPIGSGDQATGLARDNVTAPVVGVRYWLMRSLGIDAGVGFGWQSGSQEVANGGTSVETDRPSALGFAFHAGVPLAFAYGKHYTFLAIPEATVGFTTGTIKPATAPGAPPAPEIDRSGFRLDVGGRVGAEIQFGFIGVPQLALQATVGLNFRRESWKVKSEGASASESINTFGTTVQADPWAIFTNNISATYYF